MLTLKNIVKDYKVGDMAVHALKGVSINFRENEFVSILGQSGCGKTTLLNIVGGLDHYTEGDLVINGKSTKKFKDADWDTYRNHSIGFVFQSYNLIPHQTVLANVELALTLSGVSKAERKKRAVQALEKVGLGDQLNKKPNQMSGGQMQRVAIARALVNNPDILLADEPTGALDSETSVQIMEILKEVAKTKLVIMVTHNPELAEQYSTRIVRLLDGKVVDDSDPYKAEEEKEKENAPKTRKTSMSFLTALSLSFNNLLTKKGRTFMTAFAGSIGIIGIALILSVSTGVKRYIDDVQRDTLSSYPIQMQAETVDTGALMGILFGKGNSSGDSTEGSTEERTLDKVYANSSMYEMMNSLNSMESKKNNLKAFKQYLDTNEEIKKYISTIRYSYDMDLNVYTKDTTGKVVKSDIVELMQEMMKSFGYTDAMLGSASMMMSGMDAWSEILEGGNGELISPMVKEQYDVIYGDWPKNYDEIVLIVNSRNELSDLVLYALGLTTGDSLKEGLMKTMNREEITQKLGPWSYEDICSRTYKVILASEKFQKQPDGSYADLTGSEAGLQYLYENCGFDLKVVGILRANEAAISTSMSGAIAYTSALTKHVMEANAQTDIVMKQLADPKTDVISGLPFETGDEQEATPAEKEAAVKTYIAGLSVAEKADLCKKLLSVPKDEYLNEMTAQTLATMDRAQLTELVLQAVSQQMGVEAAQIQSYIDAMDDAKLQETAASVIVEMVKQQYEAQVTAQLDSKSAEELAGLLDMQELTAEDYAKMYDEFLPSRYSEGTFDENMKRLGYADAESPASISIYAETFDDKDEISRLIKEYNKNAAEEDFIEYTDFVALLMSSITTIIDAISYVLIAFVAISLVVSSIMIGIITYISVLERTKEIGILRAIGASKKDVSRVFNAETLIVGFTSGLIGILVSLLLIIVINIILFSLTGIPNLKAALPVVGAVSLILISMLLTFIAGLFPSRVAAKKDPVIALRSE